MTSRTSYGFRACWNFLRATKYLIFLIARIAFRCASVSLENGENPSLKRYEKKHYLSLLFLFLLRQNEENILREIIKNIKENKNICYRAKMLVV